MEFVNIADLKDPKDPRGRSFRDINKEKTHSIPIGTLVEIENGARAFVVLHTRDCDQSPLYSLAINPESCEFSMSHGYDEESLKLVNK